MGSFRCLISSRSWCKDSLCISMRKIKLHFKLCRKSNWLVSC